MSREASLADCAIVLGLSRPRIVPRAIMPLAVAKRSPGIGMSDDGTRMVESTASRPFSTPPGKIGRSGVTIAFAMGLPINSRSLSSSFTAPETSEPPTSLILPRMAPWNAAGRGGSLLARLMPTRRAAAIACRSRGVRAISYLAASARAEVYSAPRVAKRARSASAHREQPTRESHGGGASEGPGCAIHGVRGRSCGPPTAATGEP